MNKWDGTGYPRRLKGEQIQGKRILFLNREDAKNAKER
ncbi:MAG: hypothetical protein ISS57_11980 [Anaerolineales bacterium]|nr:hypothetical protein [Anaerolineales bacterium]